MEPHFHLVFADSTMCQLIIVKVANVNVLIYLGSNLRLTSTQCIKNFILYKHNECDTESSTTEKNFIFTQCHVKTRCFFYV